MIIWQRFWQNILRKSCTLTALHCMYFMYVYKTCITFSAQLLKVLSNKVLILLEVFETFLVTTLETYLSCNIESVYRIYRRKKIFGSRYSRILKLPLHHCHCHWNKQNKSCFRTKSYKKVLKIQVRKSGFIEAPGSRGRLLTSRREGAWR